MLYFFLNPTGRQITVNQKRKHMKNEKGTSLKARITTAFILIIIIPVVFCTLLFYFLTGYKVKSLKKEYGLENPTYESLYNSSLITAKKMDEDMKIFSEMIGEDPAKAEDKSFLERENANFQADGIFLIVRKGNEILYNGRSSIKDSVLLQELPPYGAEENTESGYTQILGDYMTQQYDFTFADGTAGSVFLLSELSRVTNETKIWMAEMIFLIILILAVTAMGMSFWIYQGVISPINRLKTAAQNIRDGRLDFTVEGSNIQEINDLCMDFEEMRIRLKQSAEEKLKFDRESKELVSNISHDLKTPVTAIRGYAEGIMDGVADTPEKIDRYIRTIYNKTNDMARLIDELTMYSKIDTNRIPYNFTKLHVTEYFDDCVDELRLEMEGRGIELSYFNYLQDDAIIIADPEQLKRVINNIISNSITYMNKEKGVINIRLRDVGDYIQAEFEDNGKGIPQKDVSRIFDRFYRTDASRNSRQGGSGIGLSIVKKILEDHEGKVWATSKENVGTVIYFVLRKYQEPEAAQPVVEEKPQESSRIRNYIRGRNKK